MTILTIRRNDSESNISVTQPANKFGVFGIKPRFLQNCNNALVACFWLTIARTLSSALTAGVVGSTLPHVEKRFGFTSRQSAIFIAIFDFASIPSLILVSVLGAQCHKPKVIGFGMLLLSASCIVAVLPHFFTSSYVPKVEKNENDSHILCGESEYQGCRVVEKKLISSTHWALGCLIMARILCAFGNTPLNTLAYNYMHDVARKEHFNIAVAVLNMAMMIGTAVGYLAGAATLELPHTWPAKADFSKSNPNYVGAWWLSYIVIALATLITFIPISAFPRDLPGAEGIRRNRKTEAHKGQEDDETAIFVHWRDMGAHAKRLIKNFPFLALAMYYSVNYSTTNGFADFAPKLVQVGFGLSASKAALAAGTTLVLAAPFGTILATFISTKFKFSCKNLLTWVCIISFTATTFAPILLAPCQGPALRHTDYNCLTNFCRCSDNEIQAVCGSDGYTYESACHAGCLSANSTTDFHNCQCLINSTQSAKAGVCPHPGCGWRLPVFLGLVFIFCALLFAEQTLATTATVRIVGASQRPMAIALKWTGIRLISPIFGPFSMGIIFDSACQLWSKKCGARRSCEMYDTHDLSMKMMILQLFIHVISTVLAAVAIGCYRKPSNNSIRNDELEKMADQQTEKRSNPDNDD
ncbi:DgyrCDS5991 [Dimorphilus gyrociliatus]|uniref:DgyrCDS5991 n=1 Tax=Dimorphilus gyrociliatus TaxID=2664684 RepID=A0A7I8VLM5_9ANNE|nr:DgyrCDS5991 [Dimorphilus gyrociliatus]